MTDEQTAAAIVAENAVFIHEIGNSEIEAAIVRALQQARDEAGRDGVVAGHMTRRAPPGHIIDDEGVVRRVLGTLPITKDGCVVGDGVSPAFWHDGNVLLEGCMGCEPSAVFADPNVPAMLFSLNDGVKVCYSTREAAEAAKEEK